MAVILEAINLKKDFTVKKGLFSRKFRGCVRAVDDVSFKINEGETFAIVGESGCGKTTTTKLILREEKQNAGSILFRGKETSGFKGAHLRQYRCSVQAVFQDPWGSLNPRMRIGAIVAEPLIVNGFPKYALKERINETLSQVGLNADVIHLFPHEFSGGQRQRIALARALALHPSLITLDEPVSALDVSIRAQIINLLKDLQEDKRLAYLLIAHDLATVRYMSHQIGVMYLGKLVEQSPKEELYKNPLHPYTKALLSAALPSHPDVTREEIILRGEVPSAFNLPCGCRFHPRCPSAKRLCSEVEPQWKEVTPDHNVACHLY